MTDYTVVLAIIKMCVTPEGTVQHVEADDDTRAMFAARHKAARQHQKTHAGIEPDDFEVIAVFAGRHHNHLQMEE